MTMPTPHGLPCTLKITGQDDHGFIFLNDHMIPITRTFRPDGTLALTTGPCDPEAAQQLAGWMAWAATVTPKGATP